MRGKIVCCIDNKECMLGWCENCPSEQNLLDFIEEFFGDNDEDHQVIYTQWDTTDRATLSTMVVDVPTLSLNSLIHYTSCNLIHFFLVSRQSI